MAGATVQIQGFAEAERHLTNLPIELRGPAVKAGLRKAGKLVAQLAKQLCPPPGYPGDKPGLPALRDALTTEVKEGRLLYAVVGPKKYSGVRARHGHLVEYGHRMVVGGTVEHITRKRVFRADRTMLTGKGRVVGWVEAHAFLGHAVDQTRSQQGEAVKAAIAAAIAKAMNG